jgi:predicted CxxxxCH...CXXCH cytochrome family protein
MSTWQIGERLSLLVAVAMLASACGDARSVQGAALTNCSSCHDQPPPTGAHREHVLATPGLGAPVACDECHVVPTDIEAPGHLDGVVQVAFGSQAKQGGLTPSYDASTKTCSNVYCHGNFPFSKARPPPAAPTWTEGDSAVACGTCHDIPPPVPLHVRIGIVGCNGPDPSNPALSCHPSAYTVTSVDPKLHIDGRVCPPFCTPATP